MTLAAVNAQLSTLNREELATLLATVQEKLRTAPESRYARGEVVHFLLKGEKQVGVVLGFGRTIKIWPLTFEDDYYRHYALDWAAILPLPNKPRIAANLMQEGRTTWAMTQKAVAEAHRLIGTAGPKVWAKGDKVMAIWEDGEYYPAKVDNVTGGMVAVKWADGSPTSIVPLRAVKARQ